MNSKIIELKYQYINNKGFQPRFILLGNIESIELLNYFNSCPKWTWYPPISGEITLKDLRDSSFCGLKILLVDKLSFLEVAG